MLKDTYQNHPDEIKDDAEVLYDQAMLIQGMPIDDPAAYARRVANLMLKAAGKAPLPIEEEKEKKEEKPAEETAKTEETDKPSEN